MSASVSISSDAPTEVDFHFDVMCPWAYQTSLWMRDVRDQLGLTVNWKFFSLEEGNLKPGKRHPWEREGRYGWRRMRSTASSTRSSGSPLSCCFSAWAPVFCRLR